MSVSNDSEGACPPPVPGDAGASDEAALLERCRAGDLEAFDRLLARHQDAVYRTALRLLGDPDEALDLAQDTLVAAFRKIGQFRGESRFSTWLYRIAVNLARNRWKAAARRPVALSLEQGGFQALDDDAPPPIQVPDPGVGPRDQAAAREMIEALDAAIAELPESFREVVVLRHVEGLAYEEIAEVLDANLGTVKSRLARAREHLRNALGPALDEFLKG